MDDQGTSCFEVYFIGDISTVFFDFWVRIDSIVSPQGLQVKQLEQGLRQMLLDQTFKDGNLL